MSISVYAHINRDEAVTVSMREGENGEYAVIGTVGLAVFVHSREKLLEIASLMERAAQEWEGEK